MEDTWLLPLVASFLILLFGIFIANDLELSAYVRYGAIGAAVLLALGSVVLAQRQ